MATTSLYFLLTIVKVEDSFGKALNNVVSFTFCKHCRPAHLKVHSQEYMRHAPVCLYQEEMPPFPLTLGFNAAIPPCSKVQLIACVPVLSRVLTLHNRTQVHSRRLSSDSPPSLLFWRMFTSRYCMRNGKVGGALDEGRQLRA